VNACGQVSILGYRSIENPSTPLSAPDSWLYDALGSGPSSAGVNVNRTTAMTYAAVWRAHNLIGDALGKCPLYTWMRGKVGGRERAVSHPAYRLLRRKPNDYMTSFVFKKTVMHHVLSEGNGYAYIERDGGARPLALLPLNPDRTHPVRESSARLWYVYDHQGTISKIRAEDVLHIRGLGFDGLVGYSVIAKARESLGLGMAAQRFGSIFFRNGSTPHVALEVPGRMSEPARKNLRDSWERAHAGLDNAHKVALLEEGVKVQQYSIRAKDAQLLETRSFEIREVANWFGLPPHKLGDSSRTAYNTLEQENQSCLEECFDPWMCLWEEECHDKLLTEEEKATESHEVEFDRKRLVQPSLGDRVKYWDTGLKNRTLTRDEVREEDGRNPIPDGGGSFKRR
jgi:HK97 family phage portal protein